MVSLDWTTSFALMPIGLALIGPAVDAFGRTSVLVVAAAAAVLPPLQCLRVPGMAHFRTPALVAH